MKDEDEDSNPAWNIASALRNTLISPNVSDSNGESANVVDALDKIAFSIMRLAKAIEDRKEPL